MGEPWGWLEDRAATLCIRAAAHCAARLQPAVQPDCNPLCIQAATPCIKAAALCVQAATQRVRACHVLELVLLRLDLLRLDLLRLGLPRLYLLWRAMSSSWWSRSAKLSDSAVSVSSPSALSGCSGVSSRVSGGGESGVCVGVFGRWGEGWV